MRVDRPAVQTSRCKALQIVMRPDEVGGWCRGRPTGTTTPSEEARTEGTLGFAL